ncbi:SMEK domain-containing protein [Sinorhizobium medicae]
MLTRGHLIGQIVDDLAGIAAQAQQRAQLHLFDLHVHVEDFAKEVLNRVLGLALVNLNAERSNNPGLDLGDPGSGWAFQVTGDKKGAKVKDTLDKIDANQRAKYQQIRILVIGKKQGSYTFEGEPFATFKFTADMVWDFDDICARLISLPIDTLTDLARYVSSETRRVRIELEVADEQGRYPTNIDHLIERQPRPQLTDASKIAAKDDQVDQAEAEKVIRLLSGKLATLPRLTREVFRFLVERRDEKLSSGDHYRISDQKLRRIYSGDDLDGDLALLEEARLITLDEPDEPRGLHYWLILFPGDKFNTGISIIEYADELKIDLRKVLVSLDFSDF